MEQFFGGNPGLVLVRLAILSLVVGVLLAALGFSPFDILESIRELVARIYDLGWTAVEKAGRYFLLGAVIVFPVWFIARLLKMLGRGPRGRPDRRQFAQPRGLDKAFSSVVMAGLVPAIHVFGSARKFVDGRDTPGHDGEVFISKPAIGPSVGVAADQGR